MLLGQHGIKSSSLICFNLVELASQSDDPPHSFQPIYFGPPFYVTHLTSDHERTSILYQKGPKFAGTARVGVQRCRPRLCYESRRGRAVRDSAEGRTRRRPTGSARIGRRSHHRGDWTRSILLLFLFPIENLGS